MTSFKPYAAKLHDGKNITIVCEGRVYEGVQNMVAVWLDTWRGNVSLTLREVYPINGHWHPGKSGYNIPIESAEFILTQALAHIPAQHLVGLTRKPAKAKARA